MENESDQNLLKNEKNNKNEIILEENVENDNKKNNNEQNQIEITNKEINKNDNNNIINEIKENINEEKNEINIINQENKKDEIIKNDFQQKEQKGKGTEKNDAKKILKNIPIYIFSAKIIEINSMNIYIYFIKGTQVPKKIVRSFKDLELYQDHLVSAWPCIYIPNFALREESIDENDRIINEERKMKMLNHFLKQIGESKHLLECQETKIFLKPAAEFADELNKIKKENHQELSDKYEKVFDDFIYDVNELNQKEAFIKDFVKILEETYKQFVMIGASIVKEMFNVKREQNTISYITNMFIDLENSMPNKKKRFTKVKEIVTPICSVSNINIII